MRLTDYQTKYFAHELTKRCASDSLEPEEGEDRLYHLVSESLHRDNLQALPASQRSLMTLVLRILLASSTFVIAGALESLCRRLRAKLKLAKEPENLEEELNRGFRSARRNG